MGLTPRQKLALNYIVGPLLFLFISYSIYNQLSSQSNLYERWEEIQHHLLDGGIFWVSAIVLLMGLNWGLEAKKWQTLVSVSAPVSFGTAFRSVMSGVSFTMLTPNRMGEFLGRVLYLPDGSRVRSAFLTMLGSLSQVAATMFFGVIGLVYMSMQHNPAMSQTSDEFIAIAGTLALGGFTVVIALLFNIGWLIRQLERFPQLSRHITYLHLLGTIGKPVLFRLLGLSVVRYLVFLAQYRLAFLAINMPLQTADAVWGTAVMFLVLAAIPSIALAELGIRGKVSLFVFGFFSSNSLGILVAAALIWLVNIVVPAIIGSIFIFRVKLFDTREKKINRVVKDRTLLQQPMHEN